MITRRGEVVFAILAVLGFFLFCRYLLTPLALMMGGY